MGSLSDDMETKLLLHLVGETALTVPDKYLSLSVADILDDESGNDEPSGNNYARVQVIDANWDVAATRLTANSALIEFPTASGDWGVTDITHWGIWDASTAGNLIAHGSLDVAKDVVNGNTPSFAIGEIEISMDASATAGGWFDGLVHDMYDLLFRGAAYTAPATFLALSTSTPTDSGPNVTEPSGNNYAREEITVWDAVVSGATENTNLITMNVPSASWGLCTHLAVYSLVTGGDPLFWGDVTDQTPTTDDTVTIPVGDLDLTIT